MTTVDERGFATIETIAASAFVFAFMAAGFTTSYVAYARAWLDRNSYETSICLAGDARKTECERRFRRDIANGLPIGRLDHVILERSDISVATRGRWSLASMSFDFEDRRPLPLGVGR